MQSALHGATAGKRGDGGERFGASHESPFCNGLGDEEEFLSGHGRGSLRVSSEDGSRATAEIDLRVDGSQWHDDTYVWNGTVNFNG